MMRAHGSRVRAAVLISAALVIASIEFAAEIPADARQPALDALNTSLLEGNFERRTEALEAIASVAFPDKDLVEKAEAALKDKEIEVRIAAALALGDLNSPIAIPALHNALDDPSGEVAFSAARALAEMGDQEGRNFLIAVLSGERNDSPGIMTNAMREAKKRIKHPESLLYMGAEDATGAMFGPAAIAFPAVKDTMQLRAKGGPVKTSAAAYLAKDPEPYAITLLEWALNDSSQAVKLEAAEGLGQRGNAGSIPKLQPLLKDPHPLVRDFAAAAIIRILDRNGEAGSPAPGVTNVAALVQPAK